jgi:hypothetical protein
MFSHGSEDMEEEAICVGSVCCSELYACIHEVSDESDISRDAIQLCYDEGRAGLFAPRKCRFKDWPVIGTARFDLNEFGKQFAVGFSKVGTDGFPLSL